MRTTTRIFLAILAVYAFLGVSPASAEWYIGGYAGIAIPNSEDIDLTVLGASATLQDVDLDNSVVFGGKVGYFFGPPSLLNFGLEVEGYHFRPDAGAQTVNLTGIGPVALDKIDIAVTGVGLNVIWRPIPGALQPYIGVGGVAAIADVETTGLSDTEVAAGFQAIAGLKWLPISGLAFFIEYKFLQTTNFEFSGTVVPGVTGSAETDITANMVYGGVAWHFR